MHIRLILLTDLNKRQISERGTFRVKMAILPMNFFGDSYDTSLHHLQVIKVVLSSSTKIEGNYPQGEYRIYRYGVGGVDEG